MRIYLSINCFELFFLEHFLFLSIYFHPPKKECFLYYIAFLFHLFCFLFQKCQVCIGSISFIDIFYVDHLISSLI